MRPPEVTFHWPAGNDKAVMHTLRWHQGSSVIATTYRVRLDPDARLPDGDPEFPDIKDGTN